MAAALNVLWSVLEIVLLIVLLVLGNTYWFTMGGIITAVSSLLATSAPTKSIFGPFIAEPLNLFGLIKVISWIVAAIGPLIALGIHYRIWGGAVNNIQFTTILVITALAIVNTIDNIVNFKPGYYYVAESFATGQFKNNPYFRRALEQAERLALQGNRNGLRSLARMQFVNMTIPILFRYLVNVGILYFCLSNLNLITTATGAKPTLFNCIVESFSFVEITQSEPIFEGVTWFIIRSSTVFITFFWLVFYVAISSGSVDEFADEFIERVQKGHVQEAAAKVLGDMAASKQVPPVEAGSDEARKQQIKDIFNEKIGLQIWSAMVDPPGQDAGREYVILVNIAKRREINLKGWALADRNDNRLEIEESIVKPQSEVAIGIPADTIYLTNKGGSIALYDDTGLKIDEVFYNKSDIQPDGGVLFGRERIKKS